MSYRALHHLMFQSNKRLNVPVRTEVTSPSTRDTVGAFRNNNYKQKLDLRVSGQTSLICRASRWKAYSILHLSHESSK